MQSSGLTMECQQFLFNHRVTCHFPVLWLDESHSLPKKSGNDSTIITGYRLYAGINLQRWKLRFTYPKLLIWLAEIDTPPKWRHLVGRFGGCVNLRYENFHMRDLKNGQPNLPIRQRATVSRWRFWRNLTAILWGDFLNI